MPRARLTPQRLVLCALLAVFAATALACGGAGVPKPSEKSAPPITVEPAAPQSNGIPSPPNSTPAAPSSSPATIARVRYARERAEATARWDARLADIRWERAAELRAEIEALEGDLPVMTAALEAAEKKHRGDKAKGILTAKQELNFNADQAARETGVRKLKARIAALTKQAGEPDSWEPHESPDALTRGQVSHLPLGVTFLVLGVVDQERVVASWKGAKYWLDGLSTEGMHPGIQLECGALVEYVDDREQQGKELKVIRFYTTGERLVPPEQVAHAPEINSAPAGKPSGFGGGFVASPVAGKTVRVSGYTRKDGTYVSPHTRQPPTRK